MEAQAVDILWQKEKNLFLERTPSSLRELRATSRFLPLGVASAYQSQPPYPVVVERAEGQWAWDIDGNQYLDLHAGFGANVFGHAHPQIVLAVSEQARLGAHYAHPTKKLGEFAEKLCKRFDLDQVRFSNSGSEATMEALRLARVYTGRQKIVRFEGAYHGHHDLVMVSMKPDPQKAGEGPRPSPVSNIGGLGSSVEDDVVPLHFGNWQSLQEVLSGEDIAAVIMEPVMCNMGMIIPSSEWMSRARELCTRYQTVLIWDQVKTGGTISWNGANSLFPDHLPDLHCLGKMIGGGLPVGAWGGRREIMQLVSEGEVDGYGTFNGNPVMVAAGSAALDLMDRESYTRLEALNRELHVWLEGLIREYRLPAYAQYAGLKGGIFWSPQPPVNYREYLEMVNRPLARLCQLWLANRGVLVAPGADEQWTLCLPLQGLSDLRLLQDALLELAGEISSAGLR